MYGNPEKRRTHRLHMPSGHHMVVGMEHMVHDKRFWAIVAFAAFMAVLITVAVLSVIYGGESPERLPTSPFFPYRY